LIEPENKKGGCVEGGANKRDRTICIFYREKNKTSPKKCSVVDSDTSKIRFYALTRFSSLTSRKNR